MEINQHNIADFNIKFSTLSPQEIVEKCINQLGENVAITSSFQISGIVLTHMIRNVKADFPVYFIDTRFHFAETLQFRDSLIAKGVNIITVQAEMPIENFYATHGANLYERNPDLCCKINKVEPYKALRKNSGIKYWMSALRKDQSATREGHQIFMIDSEGLVRIHPLIHLTWKDVWNYVKTNNIDYHPLYNMGYTSIGCSPLPCTNKSAIEEGERSGRWQATDKTECGLHEGLV